MEQLTFHGPGLLRWEHVPEPTLSTPRSALVRPVAVAACDLDGALMESRVPLAGPFPLGHEFVGVVVEVGTAVATLEAGQRVSVPFQISCGECKRCRTGLTANCEAVPPLSSYGLGTFGGLRWGGALSDLVEVPFADAMALPVPDGIAPHSLASLSDNMADAYRTVSSTNPGDEVLVVGGGSIGLYAAGLAVGRGAGVTYLDTSADRCMIAERLGAEVELRELTRPIRPRPLVVHTSGDPAQLANALLSTDHGGTCVDTSVFFNASVSLPLLSMYGRGVTFRTGRPHVRAVMPALLAEITSGRFDPAPVTSEIVDFVHAVEALAAPGTKVVLVRSDELG
jgi:threonine dehydrogenase-like Zn-dependent dehydrogenase